MNTLLTIFIAIGVIGFLFLLISLVVGDLFEQFDFDADHDFDIDHDFDLDHDFDGAHGSFGVFNSRVLSVFLTAFGGIGAASLQFGYGGVFSTILGVGGGVLFGAIVFAFGYFLYSQQASSSVTNRDLVGRTAKVIVGIQPNNIGQISCRIGDENVEKLARTRDGSEIRLGEKVFIEEAGEDAFVVSSMKGYESLDD